MFPEWVVSSVVVYNDDNDVDLRHLWTLKRKERPISFLIMARFSQIQECLQLFWLVMWSQDIWVYAVEREINYSRASFYKPLLFNCIAPTFSENLWHGTMTFTFLLRSFACLVWSTKRYYESTTMSLHTLDSFVYNMPRIFHTYSRRKKQRKMGEDNDLHLKFVDFSHIEYWAVSYVISSYLEIHYSYCQEDCTEG